MAYGLPRVSSLLNGLQRTAGVWEVMGSNPVFVPVFVPRSRHAEHLSFTTTFRTLKLYEDYRSFSASNFNAF